MSAIATGRPSGKPEPKGPADNPRLKIKHPAGIDPISPRIYYFFCT